MQAGLNLALSETPKTCFLATRPRYKLACAYSEGSSQSVYLHSLVRVLVFRMKKNPLDPWLPIQRSFKTLIRLCVNKESPAQFENRIKPRVYVRCITRNTMYEKAGSVMPCCRKVGFVYV